MTPAPFRKRRRTRMGRAGFTLLEFAVSLGFMSAMGGLIAGSSLLAMKTNAETGALANVAVETAKTTSWLVRDIRRAGQGLDLLVDERTDLAEDVPATSASFTWYDNVLLTEVTCTYSLDLDGDDLERDCGSGPFKVGRSISGLQFVLSTGPNGRQLVTATYTITPSTAPDAAETIVLNVALGGG